MPEPTHEPKTLYTGKYTAYKDSGSIENVTMEQMARMKMFKQSKPIDSQWLRKKNAVQQEIDPFYSKDTPREAV